MAKKQIKLNKEDTNKEVEKIREEKPTVLTWNNMAGMFSQLIRLGVSLHDFSECESETFGRGLKFTVSIEVTEGTTYIDWGCHITEKGHMFIKGEFTPYLLETVSVVTNAIQDTLVESYPALLEELKEGEE